MGWLTESEENRENYCDLNGEIKGYMQLREGVWIIARHILDIEARLKKLEEGQSKPPSPTDV
jgi:hypothetical protein